MTSSTAFVTGKVADENTPVYAPTKLTLPGTTVQLINDDGSACNNGSNPSGTGKVPLIYAFTVSCNTVFGAIGERLSGAALKAEGTKYGFNNPNLTVAEGMPAATSNLPLYTDPAQRAKAAVGQQSDTVTPLQEAMLSATVANNGTLMKPYLVQKVTAPDLSTIQTTSPDHAGQPDHPRPGPATPGDDDQRGRLARGHRAPHRRDPGHRGNHDRREDRDGPERHQQLGAG